MGTIRVHIETLNNNGDLTPNIKIKEFSFPFLGLWVGRLLSHNIPVPLVSIHLDPWGVALAIAGYGGRHTFFLMDCIEQQRDKCTIDNIHFITTPLQWDDNRYRSRDRT